MPMSWIKTLNFEQATGKLKKIYQRVTGPDNNVDNILQVHALRPHTLEGHMMLYKNVLHHRSNQVPKHWLEALGIYVSMLNQCDYCVAHHFEGYSRLIGDKAVAKKVRSAFESDQLEGTIEPKFIPLFSYAKILTLSPETLREHHLVKIRDCGFGDGEILEVNQVVAYFNYANRTVLGLGVTIQGDSLGLSPNDDDDPDNWGHR